MTTQSGPFQTTRRAAVLFVRAGTRLDVPAVHLEALRLAATERGWRVAREFVSSTKTHGRERSRLLGEVHQGLHGGGVLVCPSLGHVSTSARDAVHLLADLMARGWDVVAPNEIDTTVPETRDALLSMTAALVGLDRQAIAERARGALDQARRAGHQLGRKRVPVPIEQVRALLGQGKSWREISKLTGVAATTLRRAMTLRGDAPGVVDVDNEASVLEAA